MYEVRDINSKILGIFETLDDAYEFASELDEEYFITLDGELL